MTKQNIKDILKSSDVEYLESRVKQLEDCQKLIIALNRNGKFKQFLADNPDVGKLMTDSLKVR